MTKQTRGRARVGALVAVVALTLLLSAALIGYQRGAATPADDSPEAGFARDMQTHHAQAVQLSVLVRDNTDDEEVRRLAFDILVSQQQQIGQMYAWLTLWDLPQTGKEPAMTWMAESANPMDMAAMPDSAAMMPGMARPVQLEKLSAARGTEAEVQFLTLMIAHHRGGVAMADAAVELAEQPQVLSLARAMSNGQTAEIEQMNQLLRDRTNG